jgi:hypothetical protein
VKKIGATLLAAAGLAAFGLQGVATAAPAGATAHPTQCSNGKYENGWSMHCRKSNGGAYRASVMCKPHNGGAVIERDATVWKTSGLSIVYCPPLTYVVGGSTWTRG